MLTAVVTTQRAAVVRVVALLAMTVLLVSAVLALVPASRANAVPIGCTSDFYVATNTTSITVRAAGGATSTINTGTLGVLSIGLNPVDGHLYALTNVDAIGNHLYRIEADGSSTDLGAIAGLPGSATYPSMTFGADGTLWIGFFTVYRVDITTLTATTVGTGLTGDLAFVDGELYGYTPPNRLVHFNTTTNTATPATVTGLSVVGGMWSSVGHLYVGQGANIREVVGYDTASPTLTAAVLATLPAAAGDGASCASTESPFLAALNDDYTGAALDPSTGGATASVLANDLAAGAAFASASVLPTLQADGGLTGATLAADGTISVPVGATPGTYTLGYQICLVATPSVCDLANAVVLLQAAAAPPRPVLAASGVDAAPWMIAAGSLLLVGLVAVTLSAAQRRRRHRTM